MPTFGILAFILSLIVLDIFCADIPKSRQTWQQNQNSSVIQLDNKSTTPWPALGRANSNKNTQPENGNAQPKKWIQQNNIWIRNEQLSGTRGQQNVPQTPPGGNVAVRNNVRHEVRKDGANAQGNRDHNAQQNVRGNVRYNTKTGSIKGSITPNDLNTMRNNNNVQDNLRPNNRNAQISNQQALINGLGGHSQILDRTTVKSAISSTPKPSYAQVAIPKNPIPVTPSKPLPIPTSSPKTGGSKIDVSSTGSRTGEESRTKSEKSDINPSSSEATDEELRELSETLLKKDVNNAMKYVTLNLQGMTSSRSSDDEAPLPLLKIDQAATKIPSVEKLMLLYNNYFLDAAQNEVYTGQERIEENNLLDTIIATPVMQHTRSFLVQKGKIGKDPKEFKDLLRQIWFYMYSRGQGRVGSSGFEHVFVAEIKNNKVSGLHNWLYFHEGEKDNKANYLGYMKKLDLGEKGAILKYHFTFHDIEKPVGSMFIGTSPELEMALYSTCFLLRADKICPLKMNGNKFIIRTFTFRYRGKNMIGSAFPEI